jgi:hypothetical protein
MWIIMLWAFFSTTGAVDQQLMDCVDGKCRYNANKNAAKVTNFTNIPIDEDQMAA